VPEDSYVIRCPSCGARDIRPSLAHGAWDAIMKAFGRLPMRCRQCQRRFHPRARGKDEDAEEMESNED
jgi:DNA-directed RNA polymerase subunit RPC12/RpoP